MEKTNDRPLKVLFYFAHPAQYLFLRETIKRLLEKDPASVMILVKTKDVLENLLIYDGLKYTNILAEGRGKSKFAIIYSLLKRQIKLIPLILRYKPTLMIGTDASIAQVGKLLNIKRITIVEDDYAVIKSLARLTFPFTNHIICPEVCDVGKWHYKKIGYKGYMKLGYLHPNAFKPNDLVFKKYNLENKFVLIRMAKLTAHHDFGIKGLNDMLLDKLIQSLKEKHYSIYISSEDKIKAKYQPYLLKIEPNDIHHILSMADMLVSDSQSMSVEAAVLGIPSIRYSDFSGRISVLEELEHKYQLTFGIKIGNEQALLSNLKEILDLNNMREIFQQRRQKMLKEKIDVTAFMLWFINNYPSSATLMREDSSIQDQFKNNDG